IFCITQISHDRLCAHAELLNCSGMPQFDSSISPDQYSDPTTTCDHILLRGFVAARLVARERFDERPAHFLGAALGTSVVSDDSVTGGQGIGARVRRKEDARHLHGRGSFVSDMMLPGQSEVAFLRSPVA